MSSTGSLLGRKRERLTRSSAGSRGPATIRTGALERLAVAQAACSEILYRKSYDAALNDIALALQRIFSAKLVILRDGAPNERFGAAPSEVDARSWLETLDHPHDGGMTARTFLAEEQDIRPPDDSIGRLVFVPLRSSNEGALWLGFAKRVACSADDLTGLKLLGEYLALAL